MKHLLIIAIRYLVFMWTLILTAFYLLEVVALIAGWTTASEVIPLLAILAVSIV